MVLFFFFKVSGWRRKVWRFPYRASCRSPSSSSPPWSWWPVTSRFLTLLQLRRKMSAGYDFNTRGLIYLLALGNSKSEEVGGGGCSFLPASADLRPPSRERDSRAQVIPFPHVKKKKVPPQRCSPCLRVIWLQTRRTLCAPAPPPPTNTEELNDMNQGVVKSLKLLNFMFSEHILISD